MIQVDRIYIVTRFYISITGSNSNGDSDCEVFCEKRKAEQLFHKWHDEELDCRKESDCGYEIYIDTYEKFHCSWDDDKEMVFIALTEQELKKPI